MGPTDTLLTGDKIHCRASLIEMEKWRENRMKNSKEILKQNIEKKNEMSNLATL